MRRSRNTTTSTLASEGIGTRVRAARDKLNLNQQQLSKQSGVPLPTLKNIEGGRTKSPHTKTLEGLAQALRVAPGYLRTGEEPPPIAPKV